MKNNKAKEQLLAILTLASVFIFIIYLKMNPEISSNSFSDNQEINSMIGETVDEMISEDYEIKNNKNTHDFNIEDNIEKSDDLISNSIIVFTENELNRAKKYQDRNCKADNTINMAAWEYVLNNPNFNQVNDVDSNIEVVNASK